MQDIKFNYLTPKVRDICEKNKKITTNFEASNPEDVINIGFLDTKLLKLEGQISYVEKDCNELKLQNKEELLIERPVRTNIQSIYDTRLFDITNWKRRKVLIFFYSLKITKNLDLI